MKMKAEASGGVHVPPGTYKVVCDGISFDKLDNSQFGSGDVVRFQLVTEDVYDSDGNPAAFDAIANKKLTPKSKLWGWLQAFGMRFEVGTEIELEECVGREALAKVIDNEKDGSVFSKVDDIMAPLSAKAAVPVEQMSIGEWWAAVRAKGYQTTDGTTKAKAMFDREPKDLTGEERAKVLEALPAV